MSISHDLHLIPHENLVKIMQDPHYAATVNIPSYAAMSELGRRTAAEKEKGAAQAMQQPPQPPVAQQLAAADPGVASLPVPDDMFSEKSYATGGIVSFAKGGPADYNYYTAPTGSPDINAQVQAGLDLAVKNTLAKEQAGLPLTVDEQNLLASRGFIGPAHPKTAETPQFIPGTEPKQAVPGKAVPGVPGLTPKDVDQAGIDFANLYKQGQNAGNVPGTPAGLPALPAAPGVPNIDYNLRNQAAGIKAAKGPSLDRADFYGEAPDLQGIQALRKQAYGEAGVSEKPYEDVLGKLADQEKELKTKGKDDAIANFLMQLGFGAAAGKSRSALQNFGEAAVPASKGLQADLKELDAKKDRIAERQFSVMDAQNKFRQTGADSDLRDYNTKQTAFDAARRDYATTNAKLQSDQATRDDAMKHLQVTEDGQNARAALSAKLQSAGLSIQSFSAQTQRMAEQKPELFGTILTNLEKDPAYVNGTAEARNKMITRDISAAKAATTAGLNDNTLRTKALDITAKYFDVGGGGHKQYKELQKTNPVAAKKLYDDYYGQQLALAKQVVGLPQATPVDTTGWGQLQF